MERYSCFTVQDMEEKKTTVTFAPLVKKMLVVYGCKNEEYEDFDLTQAVVVKFDGVLDVKGFTALSEMM